VRTIPWQRTCALGLLISLLAACGIQAPYMRSWSTQTTPTNRWIGGTIKEQKLSADEAAVYQELGTPDAIRFFRAIQTRQRVYEWIYTEKQQVVWFVDRQRVEYIAVDTDTSGTTKESREMFQQKLIAGGLLGAVVGGFAAGMLVLGETLGLKD
jgi:hypothetical protein